MDANEKKAAAIIEAAEKKLSGWSLFGSRRQKLEDVEDSFQQAANLYKLAKNWEKAGASFKRHADILLELDTKHQAATALVNAAGAYEKVNMQAAVECRLAASDIFTDTGKFSSAAKIQKEIGDLRQSEGDLDGAIKAFDTATDYYEADNQSSQANKCRLQSAELKALLEQYAEAIEIYEQVAISCLESNLMKWNAKDYFFKAGLCHLCNGDAVALERKIEEYEDRDPTFKGQREHKLLKAILAAFNNVDAEAFTTAVAEYDNISPLDSWKTTILVRIKKSIKDDII